MFGDDVFRLELDGSPEGSVESEDVVVQKRPIDGRIKFEEWISRAEPVELLDLVGTNSGNSPTQAEFGRYVREQTLMTRDDDLGRPFARLDAENKSRWYPNE